jgi:hypothetical protein
MNSQRYSGTLYYEEGNAVPEIASFVVRDSEIGFLLTSFSPEHGRWEAESGKPAIKQANGSFLAKDVWAHKGKFRAAGPWTIEFNIEFEVVGKHIEISGTIFEEGEAGTFSGELEAKN